MLALADRCEKADGADALLDALIWVHLPEQEARAWKHGGDRYKHAAQIKGCAFIPAYTASLDAALKLVPEGQQFGVENYPWSDHAKGNSCGWVGNQHESGRVAAHSPALALCAAALRARAAQSEITDERV